MKEAAGEANMTVVTIVLIAIVLGVGTLIVTNLMNNIDDDTNASNTQATAQQACINAGGQWNAASQTCQ